MDTSRPEAQESSGADSGIRKRYVSKWLPLTDNYPLTPETWTEVTITVSDLARMLGLAPGTRLISMALGQDHSTMTWTFEEPQEALCNDGSSGP